MADLDQGGDWQRLRLKLAAREASDLTRLLRQQMRDGDLTPTLKSLQERGHNATILLAQRYFPARFLYGEQAEELGWTGRLTDISPLPNQEQEKDYPSLSNWLRERNMRIPDELQEYKDDPISRWLSQPANAGLSAIMSSNERVYFDGGLNAAEDLKKKEAFRNKIEKVPVKKAYDAGEEIEPGSSKKFQEWIKEYGTFFNLAHFLRYAPNIPKEQRKFDFWMKYWICQVPLRIPGPSLPPLNDMEPRLGTLYYLAPRPAPNKLADLPPLEEVIRAAQEAAILILRHRLFLACGREDIAVLVASSDAISTEYHIPDPNRLERRTQKTGKALTKKPIPKQPADMKLQDLTDSGILPRKGSSVTLGKAIEALTGFVARFWVNDGYVWGFPKSNPGQANGNSPTHPMLRQFVSSLYETLPVSDSSVRESRCVRCISFLAGRQSEGVSAISSIAKEIITSFISNRSYVGATISEKVDERYWQFMKKYLTPWDWGDAQPSQTWKTITDWPNEWKWPQGLKVPQILRVLGAVQGRKDA